MTIPGYWMNETSGVLRPAIEAYLLTEAEMAPEHVAAMRAYLRQWIAADDWRGDEVLVELRRMVDGLTDREAISDWLELAEKYCGIDPL